MTHFKKALVVLAVVAALGAWHASSHAHGCEGHGNCNTTTSTQTINQSQWQHQQSSATAAGGQSTSQVGPTSVNVQTGDRGRYLSVRPVTVPVAPIITPSANVSRYADVECGPRMRIVHRDIKGINNRMTRAEAIDAGLDQYVIPDTEEPYRKVQLTPDVYQLIGHRLIETTAVPNISTSGGFAIGGNGSSGAGGSFGMNGGGSLQSLQTTIRLIECVAYEVDTRPLKPRG